MIIMSEHISPLDQYMKTSKKQRGEFSPTHMSRGDDGKFLKGNTVCFLGWEHLRLLFEHLGGTEADRDEWWRLKALYHSDQPYWGTSVQKFFDPGSPIEFMRQRRQDNGIEPQRDDLLQIELDKVEELEF